MHPLTERYSVGRNNLPGAHPCCQRCSTQTHTRHEAHTDRIITAVCLVTCENTASSIRLFAESSHARHATHIRLVFRRCAAGNVCVFECALRSYIQQQLHARGIAATSCKYDFTHIMIVAYTKQVARFAISCAHILAKHPRYIVSVVLEHIEVLAHNRFHQRQGCSIVWIDYDRAHIVCAGTQHPSVY